MNSLTFSLAEWAGLHMKWFLNADGTERVLLPQTVRFSVSCFLKQSFVACSMIAASQSHFPDYSFIIQCMAPFFDLHAYPHHQTNMSAVLYVWASFNKASYLKLMVAKISAAFPVPNRVPVYQLVCVLTCCHVILFSVCKNCWVFPFIPFIWNSIGGLLLINDTLPKSFRRNILLCYFSAHKSHYLKVLACMQNQKEHIYFM